MECKFCKGNCQKAGKQKDGTRRYYCMKCKKHQQSAYKYLAYQTDISTVIPRLVCESVSVRGISRILRIALVTVTKRMKVVADKILKPAIPINRKSFELDEVRTSCQ